MVDLNVKINQLHLSNPVMTASGTFGYGLEFRISCLWKNSGQSSSRHTLEPREGNDYPRMARHGWHAQLWGCKTRRGYFCEHIYPRSRTSRPT